mmetsp:Transcript_587/g.342  ORF Transcript_587/g.342 Transcript_587/m.342 type:complete len:87 (-) Transcript_587:493-753(-)|eukprot:CAMPEP_0202979660 /NCGR_PEP_ID=MMETSP1396-20130829/85752_1 /ASSEMBLY_ACC=CAM_ASM_000872 /TAXON_ID= /ORGANISM="Pseudokeronopsis sp., Strain Brazil" /LENGTH=86 /DNA_ID=CAMNT_0049719191 /DNA_START=587 /DNA_END=847 /DNA_ORIENTATION=-
MKHLAQTGSPEHRRGTVEEVKYSPKAQLGHYLNSNLTGPGSKTQDMSSAGRNKMTLSAAKKGTLEPEILASGVGRVSLLKDILAGY